MIRYLMLARSICMSSTSRKNCSMNLGRVTPLFGSQIHTFERVRHRKAHRCMGKTHLLYSSIRVGTMTMQRDHVQVSALAPPQTHRAQDCLIRTSTVTATSCTFAPPFSSASRSNMLLYALAMRPSGKGIRTTHTCCGCRRSKHTRASPLFYRKLRARWPRCRCRDPRKQLSFFPRLPCRARIQTAPREFPLLVYGCCCWRLCCPLQLHTHQQAFFVEVLTGKNRQLVYMLSQKTGRKIIVIFRRHVCVVLLLWARRTFSVSLQTAKNWTRRYLPILDMIHVPPSDTCSVSS